MAINFPSAVRDSQLPKKEAVHTKLPKICATDEKLSNSDCLKNRQQYIDELASNTAAIWLAWRKL